jgi:hypothetical protein
MEEAWLKSERGRVKLEGEYGDADVENLRAVVVVVVMLMIMICLIDNDVCYSLNHLGGIVWIT